MLYDGIELIDNSNIDNFALLNGTVDPAGQSGELFFKSDTKRIRFYDGTEWKNLIVTEDIPASGTTLDAKSFYLSNA